MQPLCLWWGHQLALNPLSTGGEQGHKASNPCLGGLLLHTVGDGGAGGVGCGPGNHRCTRSGTWPLRKAGDGGPCYITCCSPGETAQGHSGAHPGWLSALST